MNNILKISLLAASISLVQAPNLYAEQTGWDDIDLPLTQKQFCRVYKSNIDALNTAIESRNDIKINVALDNIEQDLISLLPGYQFENWVGKMSTVKQGPNGKVGVELNLQCNLSLVTGSKMESSTVRGATISPDSRLYRELAKLNHGDYVLMSGALIDFEDVSSLQANSAKYTNSDSFVIDVTKLSKY